MKYRISTQDDQPIILGAVDDVTSILQNIRVLLGTWMGEVPLYRDFGIDPKLLHKPMSVVQPMLIADITDSIEQGEPRAAVLGVSVSSPTGKPDKLSVTVEVEVKDG
jgi:phage baseplate assembly protein W